MNTSTAPTRTILLVDDTPNNLTILTQILTMHGYEVRPAINGRIALKAIQNVQPDLILLDIMMPEMDGYELCRRLKADEDTREIPVLFISALDDTMDKVKAFEIGGVDYITKPFQAEEVLARVNTHLALKEAREELIRKNEEIRRLAITDPLTGCYNRGYLSSELPSEVKRARRYQRPLVLIMCDLDLFKQLNDMYGHQAGDFVLQKYVEHLQGMLRQDVDWVVRYGGEEFIIVLPETSISEAYHVAERLRLSLAQKIFPFENTNLRITSSFGVTGFDYTTPEEFIAVDTLIKYADIYLYQAKEEGRNRVKHGPLGRK